MPDSEKVFMKSMHTDYKQISNQANKIIKPLEW